MTTYSIQSRETGDIIESNLTKKDAKELVEKYELQDREDGIFEPNFYEIV